jgi:hypothetical protein
MENQMAQAKSDNITVLPSRPPPYEPPKSIYGNDECWLKMCADWRSARAEQQKNWAEHEKATMWGSLPDKDIKLDCEPLCRMHDLERILADVRPRTALLAQELLGIAITILAYAGEDPKGRLAQGPVLDIGRTCTG